MFVLRNFCLLILFVESVVTVYGAFTGILSGAIPYFCLPFMALLGVTMLPLLYSVYFYGIPEEK